MVVDCTTYYFSLGVLVDHLAFAFNVGINEIYWVLANGSLNTSNLSTDEAGKVLGIVFQSIIH